MTVTLETLRTEVMQRLGDSAGAIWPGAEIDGYIQEGYDQLTMLTGCLWATDVLPDYAAAFNYTAPFELEYFVGGDPVSGCAQFTAEFERDYLDNAQGPANHNYRWEFNDGYVDTTICSALADLPEDLYEIERATWNTRRIEALRSRDLETCDSRYELSTGQVDGYLQDKDGLGKLRKYRVPSAAYEPYDVDASSTDLGLLITVTDLTDADPIQEWGDLVQIPNEHPMGDPWGVIVAVYSEPAAVRIEYRRRGLPLSSNQSFEIPDRCTVYVRHFSQARALAREGPGQDVALSAHYQSRYEAGIERMKRRKQAMAFQKKSVMGGNSGKRAGKPLARLPYQYGKAVR